MAESYPNDENESDSDDGTDKKDTSSSSPRIIEKSSGDTRVPKFEGIFRQLDETKLSTSEPHVPEKTEHSEARHQDEAAAKNRDPFDTVESYLNAEEPRQNGEPERQLHRPSADELANLAAQVEQAKLEAMQRNVHAAEIEKAEKDDDEDDDDDESDAPVKKFVAESRYSQVPAEPEQTEAAEAFDAIMQQNAPEFADATSGDDLNPEALPEDRVTDVVPDMEARPESTPATMGSEDVQRGPAAENDSERAATIEPDFQSIVGQPELADLAAIPAPEVPSQPGRPAETTEPESFESMMQNHPDLQELGNRPEMSAASSPDEGFNDIIRNSFGGEDGGPTRFQEQLPGESPVDVEGGGANLPPFSPTAEGAWDGGRNSWTSPTGAVLDPASRAGLAALEARRGLRHTATEAALATGEAALAGAAGLLGVGLVAEYLRARHQEKKLKKQLNQQNKNLYQTNQALQQEHLQHQRTRQQLEGLTAQRSTTTERMHQPQVHESLAVKTAEVAAGASLISAAAATELAAKVGHTVETSAPKSQQINERELAQQLKDNRELGKAIRRNPELRDIAETAALAGAAAEQSFESREQDPLYDDTLPVELRHERLQSRRSARNGAGQNADGAGVPLNSPVPTLPAPQASALAPDSDTPNSPGAQRRSHSSNSKLANPWAWATVAFVVAVLIFVAFVR